MSHFLRFSSPIIPASFWRRLLVTLLLAAGLAPQARAGHGIFAGLVKVGGTFYNLAGTGFTNYQSANLGSFAQGQAFILNGGELKTYKNGGDNVAGANLLYTVYPQGARPGGPSFGDYTLPFAADLGSGDQSWNTYGGSVNLLNGLAVGTYVLEFYGRSSVDYNGGGNGYDYLSNGGLNYTATFTVTPAPLPVELAAFEAIRQEADAALAWTTASEKNNQGFEVQVSTTGQEFRALGFVAGAGSSTAPRHYRFLDTEKGKAGLRYYRLRQLDADGTATYSPVHALDFTGAPAVLNAAPLPFATELTLTLRVAQPQPGTLLTLSDATGRIVLSRPLDVPAGLSQLPVADLAGVPAGLYVLQLALAGQPVRLKVIKE